MISTAVHSPHVSVRDLVLHAREQGERTSYRLTAGDGRKRITNPQSFPHYAWSILARTS